MRLHSSLLALILALSPACGDDKGGGSTGSTGTGTGANTGTSEDTSAGTSAGTGETDTSTSDTPTTGGTGTGTDTGTGATTGTALPNFERFKQARAAGPCPPEGDCDGFVELLATQLLRVEKFGELDNPVTEVAISDQDFIVAVEVFADAALLAVLDGPDPLCDPPTDVFESMEVVIDGTLHDATTTSCDQPPLVAARDMVEFLRTKYVP